MKKALCFGPRDVRIVDVPERDPGPGEVRSRMMLTTLTTANVRLYQGPLVGGLKYPVTLSYTGVGIVESVGAGVTRFKPGDHVYPNWYHACGECAMCRADRMVACLNMKETDHNMMVGEQYESALQDYTIFPEKRLWPVPSHVPHDKACMTGFLSVAMQAITVLDPEPGDTVLITGAGPIGWGITQHAKLRGARVVICDVKADRLAQAAAYGADATIDVSKFMPEGEAPSASGSLASPDATTERHLDAAGLKQAIVEASGGPPLLVAEATGTAEGSKAAFDAAGRGARLAVIGVTTNPITQHFLILKGLTVSGIGGAIKVQRTIDLIAAGKLDLSQAISHRYPFSQLQDALERKRTDPEANLVAVDVARWE